MKAASKKFFFVLISTLLIISLLLPLSAYADEPLSTLGTEEPYMFCTFIDAQGKMVDGNALPAGDYTVNVNVGQMENASILQFTAEYDSEVITNLDVTGTIADDANSNVSCGGIKDENDILVIVLASEDENSSALDAANGTAIATMDVTIATAAQTIDFADYFSFSDDPDLTFLEADYADGYDDAYVTDVTAVRDYNTYLMTADASPAFYVVSGVVNVAQRLDGTYEGNGKGIIGITASLDVDGVTVTAVTDANGCYSLSGVPFGTYEVSFSGPYTIDRTLSFSAAPGRADANGVIAANPFGICNCDWNGDGFVQSNDLTYFKKYMTNLENGLVSYDPNYDVNCDGYVQSNDKTYYKRFSNHPNSEFYTVDVNL